MDYNRYIVSENNTIRETMKVIGDGGQGIAFICKNDCLLAAVSDGDIRRYILQSGDIDKPISLIGNYHPKFAFLGEKIDYFEYMTDNYIFALPLVKEDMKVVKIIFMGKEHSKLNDYLGSPVVIMAGGKGTRLQPYTQILPKPLIPIGDKTITEHIMGKFEDYHCTHFDMIINYKKIFIKSYFQECETKRDISFIEEPDYWGTAGGLKLIEGKYKDSFFVTNCDILINADYAEIFKYHQKQKNIITMVCAYKKVVIPYGAIDIGSSNNVISIKEKPEFKFLTNTGFYVITPQFIKKIPDNTFIHITDVIQTCIKDGEKVGYFLINEDDWMDMGQFETLEQMKNRIGKK